jgi:magnesium chelatase family protein
VNFSIINGAQISGLEGEFIKIETDVCRGFSNFNIIGLADKMVDESKDRILSALRNSNLPCPKNKNQRVTVSLIPSHKKKSGSGFDLPITISYLQSIGEINVKLQDSLFAGELSLNGQIKPIPGITPIILLAKKMGLKNVFIPYQNKTESSIIKDINIYPCKDLQEIVSHLKGRVKISTVIPKKNCVSKTFKLTELSYFKISGQDFAKRGLEIAVAGGHNISFYGSPGTGKTFLAKTIIEILPKLNYEKTLECEIIKSISNNRGLSSLNNTPPFRSPHHGGSYSAIIGGGGYKIMPGEITLAHNGVLFMDEFPEFNRNILESLRQPLEDGYISISRMNNKVRFPANFLLVTAMNPCPCGYHKSNRKKCTCTIGDIRKYKRKISGPLLDRIDLSIKMDEVEHTKLLINKEVNLKEIRSFLNKIKKVREINKNGKLNGELNSNEISKIIKDNNHIKNQIDNISQKLNLSARSYFKIIKISKTISELDECDEIKEKHLMEALQYRPNFD